MDKNLRAYLVEMIGTFAFVFVSAGTVCACQQSMLFGPQPAGPAPDPSVQPLVGLLIIGLATGFAYAAALAFTLPYANGYLNPAVTLVLWVFKRLDGGRTAGLIGAQLLGAAVAGMVLRFALAGEETVLINASLGTPHLHTAAFHFIDFWALLKGILLELVLTAFVVFVLFATLFDPRAPRWGNGWVSRLAPLWAGLAVAAATFLGFNLTGAALNPARWFGTVVWELSIGALQTRGPFADHAVYWIGPILGALAAGSIYTSLLMPEESEVRATERSAVGMAANASSTLLKAKR